MRGTLNDHQHFANASSFSDLTLPFFGGLCSLRKTWRQPQPPALSWICCCFCRFHLICSKWTCKRLSHSLRSLRQQSTVLWITLWCFQDCFSFRTCRGLTTKPQRRQCHLLVKLGDRHDSIWLLRSQDLGGYGRQPVLLALISPRIGRLGKYKYSALPAFATLPLALFGRTHKVWWIDST